MSRILSALLVVLGVAVASSAADPKPIEPFNGKDLSGWTIKNADKKSSWMVGAAMLADANPAQFKIGLLDQLPEKTTPQMICTGGGTDISTEEKFGDCTIGVEFMVPKGSNSGVYVMGEYEVQVFDSYGKEKLGMGDLGALYSAAAPKVNASKKPGEWQKFVIEFQAPKFDGDKKTANAKFVKVVLNDQVLHENVEMKGPTPGGLTGKEAATGPVMFQGDHGAVAYRNIKITPKK